MDQLFGLQHRSRTAYVLSNFLLSTFSQLFSFFLAAFKKILYLCSVLPRAYGQRKGTTLRKSVIDALFLMCLNVGNSNL